jgi:hypothetical protein
MKKRRLTYRRRFLCHPWYGPLTGPYTVSDRKSDGFIQRAFEAGFFGAAHEIIQRGLLHFFRQDFLVLRPARFDHALEHGAGDRALIGLILSRHSLDDINQRNIAPGAAKFVPTTRAANAFQQAGT